MIISTFLTTFLTVFTVLPLATCLPQDAAADKDIKSDAAAAKGIDFSYNKITVPPNFPPFPLDKKGFPAQIEVKKYLSRPIKELSGPNDASAANSKDIVKSMDVPWYLHCETSWGSPYFNDVRTAYEAAIRRGDRCYQRSGSGCSNHQSAGSASISFCAPYGSWMPCWQLGAFARDLSAACGSWMGRIGGYIDVYNPDTQGWGQVVVYHS